MKHWLSFVTGAFVGISILSVIYAAANQPRGEVINILPAPTAAPLMIQVAGEVQQPGIYTLPRGARVQDAVQAAGGFTTEANQSGVNLAARLRDGEKVLIPGKTATRSESADESSPETVVVNFPIDLNTATLEELDQLPGIGPSRAQDILNYREQHNGFSQVEEIKDVPGIGDTTYERMKDLIYVENLP